MRLKLFRVFPFAHLDLFCYVGSACGHVVKILGATFPFTHREVIGKWDGDVCRGRYKLAPHLHSMSMKSMIEHPRPRKS